ncbi:hypothetical protein NIIg97_gp63 [Geobacillus phage vB_GthS_NIIg9.7]|nr:hypothetical protein NIIg97_gp63 [Geobacillus phage vB_GthS_NIIg9.7]
MSEWLTTGEMIDRLKVGEVAECVNENYKVMFKATEGLVYVDDDGKTKKKLGLDGRFIIANSVLKNQLRWRILPRYVSFEEAMKALMNGKTVWLWQGDEKAGYYIDKESGKLWAIVGDSTAPVNRIWFGDKWTIEE